MPARSAEDAGVLLIARSTVQIITAGSEADTDHPASKLLDLDRTAGSWRSAGTSAADSWLLLDHGRAVATGGVMLTGGRQEAGAYLYRVRRSSANPLDELDVPASELARTNYAADQFANVQDDPTASDVFDDVATPTAPASPATMDVLFPANSSALKAGTTSPDEDFHQVWIALRRTLATGSPTISMWTRDTASTWVLQINAAPVTATGIYSFRFKAQDVADYDQSAEVVAVRWTITPDSSDTLEVGGVGFVPDYDAADYDSGWKSPASPATQIAPPDAVVADEYALSEIGAFTESRIDEPYMADTDPLDQAQEIEARYTLIEVEQRHRFDRRGVDSSLVSQLLAHQALDAYEFRLSMEGPARALIQKPGISVEAIDLATIAESAGGVPLVLTYPDDVDDDWLTLGRVVRIVSLEFELLDAETFAELDAVLDRVASGQPVAVFVRPQLPAVSRIYSVLGRASKRSERATGGHRGQITLIVEEL